MALEGFQRGTTPRLLQDLRAGGEDQRTHPDEGAGAGHRDPGDPAAQRALLRGPPARRPRAAAEDGDTLVGIEVQGHGAEHRPGRQRPERGGVGARGLRRR